MAKQLKRYSASVSFYIYGKDDKEVQKKLAIFIAGLNKKYDNHASVDSIVEIPFGSFETRKVK